MDRGAWRAAVHRAAAADRYNPSETYLDKTSAMQLYSKGLAISSNINNLSSTKRRYHLDCT